jgi:hypothetical protein
MENKWEVTSDVVDGIKCYRVYLLKDEDENEVDHSGNREYARLS